MSPEQLQSWSAQVLARVESALGEWVPASAPAGLGQAMRYGVLDGGKRLRALLVEAAAEAVGALDTPVGREAALRAACAVELIHAYSLVHDDLPCMDDDVLRRGRPTCHVEFDEATALLVGDALQTLAFQVLAESELPSHQRRLSMIALLAQAAGSRGMAGGQAIDLAAVGTTLTLEELEFMHIRKTGALIRAAVLLGAHCGNADETTLTALGHYANRAGLLFQVVDDILDAEGSTVTLGKTAGKDAAQDKPTYVSMLGLPRAKEFAAQLRAQAHEALAACPVRTERLAALTNYIVDRSF